MKDYKINVDNDTLIDKFSEKEEALGEQVDKVVVAIANKMKICHKISDSSKDHDILAGRSIVNLLLLLLFSKENVKKKN